MIEQIGLELTMQMVQKGYVLFAPKSEHGLKYDYPELKADPAYQGLTKYDMLFVWAMGCASSPFIDIENDVERREACIFYAYPQDMRESRYKMFKTLPENIKRGIAQMEKYSLGARVTEYVLTKQIRDNIHAILGANITMASDEEKESYLSQAKTAQAILADQRKRIEGLDLGISEAEDTKLSDARDIRELYMQQQRQ